MYERAKSLNTVLCCAVIWRKRWKKKKNEWGRKKFPYPNTGYLISNGFFQYSLFLLFSRKKRYFLLNIYHNSLELHLINKFLDNISLLLLFFFAFSLRRNLIFSPISHVEKTPLATTRLDSSTLNTYTSVPLRHTLRCTAKQKKFCWNGSFYGAEQ